MAAGGPPSAEDPIDVRSTYPSANLVSSPASPREPPPGDCGERGTGGSSATCRSTAMAQEKPVPILIVVAQPLMPLRRSHSLFPWW